MPAAVQRAVGGVFLTFPEDLRPLSAIDYIMYCHSRYVPTSEVGGAEKRLSSPEKRLTAPVKYAILPSALMLVWLSWQSSSLVMSRSPVRIRPQAPKKQHPRGCCFFVCGTSLVQIRKPLVSKALRDAAGAVGGVGEQGKIGRRGRPEDEKEHHSQVDDHAQHLPGDRVKF